MSRLAGGKAKAIQEAQERPLTAAALKRAGTTANRATPEVRRKHTRGSAATLTAFAAGANARIDQQFANDLGKITNRLCSSDAEGTRAPIADHIVNSTYRPRQESSGGVNGEQYKTLRSPVGVT